MSHNMSLTDSLQSWGWISVCLVPNRLSQSTVECCCHAGHCHAPCHPPRLQNATQALTAATLVSLQSRSDWGVTEPDTHTLRTWSQRQTHTVRTDACLKGSFPLQAEGQRECLCVIFVNWGLSCRSVDKRNSSSTRFRTRSADRFLTTPHVIYTGTLHSNQTQQAWTGVKQHVDIWDKYEKCFRHLGHINSISLTTLQCAVTTC